MDKHIQNLRRIIALLEDNTKQTIEQLTELTDTLEKEVAISSPPKFEVGQFARYTGVGLGNMTPPKDAIGMITKVEKDWITILCPSYDKPYQAIPEHVQVIEDFSPEMLPKKKQEFRPGMIVRYDGENRGGKPPPAGAIGSIITKFTFLDSANKNFELLFPPGTCNPNPYSVLTENIELVI